MSKFKTSQILMLTLLAALLFVTPLLSSSIRPKYLYFIINLVIIALGAEAGLLSAAFSKPLDYDKTHAHAVPISTPHQQDHHHQSSSLDQQVNEKKKKSTITTRAIEKSASEKIVKSSNAIKVVEKVKKCPSMSSLFFIGNGESTAEVVDDQDHMVQEHEAEEEEEEVREISGQELFTKSETFIGNFYKQLKMQREESWKRIHGFYQKAF